MAILSASIERAYVDTKQTDETVERTTDVAGRLQNKMHGGKLCNSSILSTEKSSASAVGDKNTDETVNRTFEESRKGEQRYGSLKKKRRSPVETSCADKSSSGPFRNRSGEDSSTGECKARTAKQLDKLSSQQSIALGNRNRSSSSKSSVGGKIDEINSAVRLETSDDSSSDDDGDEINLRAKTAEKIYKQGEHLEESDEDDNEFASDEECGVQASFGLFDPREEDTDAVACLLRQSLLRSHLKFSLSNINQLATVIAQQGNVGSALKTVDEDTEEEGRWQRAQGNEPDDTSSTACEKGKNSGGGSAVTSGMRSCTAAAGEEGRKSAPVKGREGKQQDANAKRKDEEADEQKQKDEDKDEDEAETLVGFLTLLSFRQYPEVVAPFKKAVLKLASQHAPAEQASALERIFLTSSRESGSGSSNEKRRGSNNPSTGETVSSSAAQLWGPGDEGVNCGWLLKERLTNTPPQLIPQMYDSLLDDISWSLSTEEMEEAERPFYAYSHVCGLTRVYKAKDGPPVGDFKRHKTSEVLPFDTIFAHPEDEILLRFATQAFAWPTGHSVRISSAKSWDNASPLKVNCEPEQTSSPSNTSAPVRSCPEYLLFFALPFEQFRQCKEAIAARARDSAK